MVVEDNNGCKISKDTVLAQPEEIIVKYSVINPLCSDVPNGIVEFTIDGGVSPYSCMFEDLHYDNGIYTIEGLKEGVYSIDIYDANSCILTLPNVTLSGLTEKCFEIPNAFTPNGDGINDEFVIRNIEFFPDATISVFNEWGQKVYEAHGGDKPWDGKYKSKNVPAGSYIYIIQLKDNKTKYSGIISVVY
jgi:gliding motility-associated-like protein